MNDGRGRDEFDERQWDEKVIKDGDAACTLEFRFADGSEAIWKDVAMSSGTVIIRSSGYVRRERGNWEPEYWICDARFYNWENVKKIVPGPVTLTATQYGVSETWKFDITALGKDIKRVGNGRRRNRVCKDMCQAGYKVSPGIIKEVGGQIDELEMKRMCLTETRKAYLGRRTEKSVLPVLTSSPYKDFQAVEVLCFAASMVVAVGGYNCAGDAKDAFHQQVLRGEMKDAEMKKDKPFRIAWKGKVTQAMSMHSQAKDRLPMVLLTIQGGEECDWEREELSGIVKSFNGQGLDVSIHHCENLDELYKYLLSITSEPSEPSTCTVA